LPGKINFKKRILSSLPVIIWMIFIFFLSSKENLPDLNKFILNFDKIAHFIVYFVLGIFLQVFFIINFDLKRKQFYYIFIIAVGFTFALSDEYHQIFVPNREPDLYDLIFDFLGIIFSIFFIKIIKKNLKNYKII